MKKKMFQIEGGEFAKAERQEKAEQFLGTKSIWFIWIIIKQGGNGDKARENYNHILKDIVCRFKAWIESQKLGHYWCVKYQIALATA